MHLVRSRSRLRHLGARAALVALAALATLPPGVATAQELALSTQAPRFFYAPRTGAKPVELDSRGVTLLQRVVTLQVERPTVGRLLAAIEEQSGIRFGYSRDVVPVDRVVALQAERITVGAALLSILMDTGVDVVLSPDGKAGLVAQGAGQRQAPAPGSVSGRVRDAKTGAGIVGAEVTLEGTRARAVAGEDGRYRLAEVAPGSYTLVARRLGYAPGRAAVTVAEGEEVAADVALEARTSALDEVVVTGTMVPTEVRAIPTPVTVITAEQIEQQQIRNYAQLLRQVVPGMVAWEDGTRPDANAMSVRGASSLVGSQLKVYVDGMQVAENYFSHVDPNSIERIEIIRGPQAAALYGSDAIGGVLEIFTKRGDPSLDRLQGSLQTALGAIQSRYRNAALRQSYSGELRGASGNASFNLGGGYSRDGEWIDLHSASKPSVYGGVRFEQGAFGLDLTARYYGQNYHSPFDQTLKATGYSSYQSPSYYHYQSREESYGVQLRYKVTPGWQHQFLVGADRYSHMVENYRPQLRTPDDTLLTFQEIWRNRISVAYRSSLTAQLSPAFNAIVTAGVDYNIWRYSYYLYSGVHNLTGTIQTAPTAYSLALRDRSTNAGYFAQAQLGFRDALFLTGSARLEQSSDFGDDIGTPVSPRVGISYVRGLGEATLKLRSAYGEAIKPPTSGMKSGATFGSNITEPNPNLRPERQVGPEVGADLVFGSRATLGVTYYRQTAKDLIATVYLTPMNDMTVFRYENVGRVRNNGVELEGKLDMAGVQLTGQYAYTSSKILDAGPDYTGEEQVGEQVSFVPKHTAGATIGFTPFPRLGVTAAMAYVGSRNAVDWMEVLRCLGDTGPCHDYLTAGDVRAFWARIPGFAKLNLSVNYELRPRLTPYVAIENLTNSNPVEQSAIAAQPGRITTVGLRLQY